MPASGVPRLVRLLVGLLLLALVAPLACAQPTPPNQPQLNANLEDPGHPLQPGANETITMKVNYGWGLASLPGPLPDMGDPTNSGPAPTPLTYQAKGIPTWVDNVSFDPPMLNATYDPRNPASTYSAPVNVILHIKRDAPSGNHQNLTVEVTAAPNGAASGATATTPELMLRPGIVPSVTVALKDNLTKAIVKGGRATPITFTVTNTGNGELTAQLNVTTRPQDSIVEDLPPVITLKAGEAQDVDVMLRIPWTYGEEGTLTLEATPISGEETGKAASADVDIAGQSAVPGFQAPGLALALCGVALLLRRARRGA